MRHIPNIPAHGAPPPDASTVPYTPAKPANWPVVPNDVAEALDELAAEVTALELGVTQTGFDTTTNLVTTGLLGYLDTTAPGNVVQKAIATSLAASRVFGANEGVVGSMTVAGTIESQLIEAGITVAAGDRLYLSAVTDGAVTNVPPSGVTQIVVSVGIARTAGTGAGGTVPMVLEIESQAVALNKLNGTAAPTAANDASQGYSPGSLWVWQQGVSIGEGVWICYSAGLGVADWRRVEALNNLTGAAIPTSNEDANDGYSKGSLWIWPGHGTWICGSAITTGAGFWTIIGVLNNPAGAAPPTVNDDSGDGYGVGSLWIGPSNDVWMCTDATAGAAVWASQAQPAVNEQAAGYAIAARDIGNVIWASGAGAQAFSLPDLSAAIGSVGDVTHPQAARIAIVTIVCANAATAVTITPGAGSQINNAGVGVPYVAPAGGTISLKSKDGLSWVAR